MGYVHYCIGVLIIVIGGCGGEHSVTRWQVYESVVGGHPEQRIQILAKIVNGRPQAESLRVICGNGAEWRLNMQGDDPAFWQTSTLLPLGERNDVSPKHVGDGESIGEVSWTDVDHLLPSIRPPASQPAGRVINREQAVSIAKDAVKQNETWGDRASYDAQAMLDGHWAVTVWRIEPDGYLEIGGHLLILIDKDGRVAHYIRGY